MTTKTAKANYIQAVTNYNALSESFQTREARRENRPAIAAAYDAKVKAEYNLVDMGFEKLEGILGKNMNTTLEAILSDADSRENIAILTLKYI